MRPSVVGNAVININIEDAITNHPRALQELIDQLINEITNLQLQVGDLEGKQTLAYSSQFNFSLYQMAVDPSNNNLYLSLSDNNRNNPLTDTTFWKQI